MSDLLLFFIFGFRVRNIFSLLSGKNIILTFFVIHIYSCNLINIRRILEVVGEN